jgi:hypothetical protein
MIVFIYTWLKNAVFRREAQTSRCSRCTAAALLLVVVLPPPPLLVVVVAAAALLLVVVVVAAAVSWFYCTVHDSLYTVQCSDGGSSSSSGFSSRPRCLQSHHYRCSHCGRFLARQSRLN